MKTRILVVDDEESILIALRGLLKRDGHDVIVASNGDQALERIGEEAFDLVLTDLSLGKGPSGMDVLAATREKRPETAIIMITAHGSEKVAVDAMKAGADDYVPKPFDNDEIRVVVARALEHRRLGRDNRLLREQLQREYGFDNLIGTGAKMRRVFETIQKVAPTDLTTLIRGESGTGKELVAQAIHNTSSRRDRPFVAVNCAAINRELVESELFGHEKGAFTGADASRVGRFAAATGGTIFLDEIGDMASETQAKVLRALQERTIEPVGGSHSVEVDVRVLAATHQDLEAGVADGSFREDLYCRLKVVELVLPPLRERTEDIAALTERFLEKLATRLGQPQKRLSPDAMTRLMRHSWPGNVRELSNLIERAAVLADGDEVTAAELGLELVTAGPGPSEVSTGVPFNAAKREAVAEFESRYLSRALDENDGNISRTAEAIGMVRQSLQQKLRDLGLRPAPAKKP